MLCGQLILLHLTNKDDGARLVVVANNIVCITEHNTGDVEMVSTNNGRCRVVESLNDILAQFPEPTA